jgi:hypothetical protein
MATHGSSWGVKVVSPKINKPWLLSLMGSLMNSECRTMHD